MLHLAVEECDRPHSGCRVGHDVYQNVDCDGDGILDHVCSTTINDNKWLVLSSEGCPSNWGTNSRDSSECPAAFEKGNFGFIPFFKPMITDLSRVAP